MGNQLGLRFDGLGEPLDDGIGNAAVKLLALAPYHSGIGRILNQRVLENVDRIRWLATDEDQLARGKVRKSRVQRGTGDWGDSGEQAIREFATYGSANLRDLLAWTKFINTRAQRAQQRSRNNERRYRSNRDVPVTHILEQPRFQNCLGELLGEQRNAIGLTHDLFL